MGAWGYYPKDSDGALDLQRRRSRLHPTEPTASVGFTLRFIK